MDKMISEEERIRRAEEISARRNNRIPVSNINSRRPRKLSTLSKIFIQVICSICIFGIFYFVNQNNSYAMDKIKPILSEDTNFNEIYIKIDSIIKDISNKINGKENNKEIENSQSEENNENNENTSEENQEENENTNIIEDENNVAEENVEENENNEENTENELGVGGSEENINISETDQDVAFIKENASFIKPVNGYITSGYGEREATEIISANHAGVDIGANTGTEIVASMSGTVELVSSYGDYGNHIKITNGEISTLYAHCSQIIVNQGDYINQGQKIAEVGSTGRTTGPHLHFEIRRNEKSVDPQKILDL